MTLIAALVGFFAAPVASAIVYVDSARHSLSVSKRLAWAGAVGGVSFGGFLVPYVFDDQLHRAYFHGIKSNPIATSPYEVLALHLTVGITISLASVVLSLTRGRYSLLR